MLKKIILSIISISIGLLLTEGFLRVTGYGEIDPQMRFDMNTKAALQKGQFVSDKELFWKLPGGNISQFDRAINAVHPDRQVPYSDKKKVLVLGDSCSRLSIKTLPYSAMLQEKMPDAVVYNASVPGYSSHQGLLWLKKQLLQLKPDIVVVYFGWNDHWRTTGTTDKQYSDSMSKSGPRLLSLFDKKEKISPLRVPVEQYRNNLYAIASAVENAGANTLFVVAPYKFSNEAKQRLVSTGYLTYNDNATSLHREYLKEVLQMSDIEGCYIANAATIFSKTESDEPLLHRDGIHLTDIGHNLMSEILYSSIKDIK
ncbi:SGNH/GDSL hydrolase family protein [bacterium]|jgi:lysophospholipase L1-like esterase|nr:SGNH/GDSL hydrolase family protein [bacterium]